MIDRDFLSELQLVLLEPPDGGDTWPSLIWERDEVLDALNAGIRALARDTHLDVASVDLAVPGLRITISLPPDWLATAMLTWRAQDHTRTPLGPVDSFEGDLAVPGWEFEPGLPLGYADLDRARLTLRLVPTPILDGTVELIYIRVPPLATGDPPGTLLPIADEFVAGVKYAALATLLRKVGRLLDPERAEYCDRRYQLTQTCAEIILGGWS